MAMVLILVSGLLDAWWVGAGAGAIFIVLLPRHPRVVAAAIAGDAAVVVIWSILWTLSW
jgi:hypothetical protein